MFYFFLLLGLLIRLILIPIPGFKADIAFWKGWGLAAADKGVVWMMTNTNFNYPPGFSYVLWFVNKTYALFADPHNINEYWADNNILYLFLLKIITIAADLAVVWVIIRFFNVILGSPTLRRTTPESNNDSGRASLRSLARMTKNTGKILALFYFLNPAVIYDGVVWGQVDQFGLALFLLSVYLVIKDKPVWGASLFTISTLMKFQNIIFIPLFYLFIFRRFWTSQNDIAKGFRVLVSSLSVTFLTFIIVIFPFFIGKQMDKVIWLLTINSDWFPWYSLNAFNGWWVASGLKGMQVVDKHLVFGITSAKQFGLFLFVFAYFISTIIVLFSKRENLFKNFILACSLAVFAFFHLLTQSHERYLFPVMGLLPILYIYSINSKLQETRNKWFDKLTIPSKVEGQTSNTNDSKNQNNLKFKFWNFFVSWELGFGILLSIFFFLNMYLSMGWNYPDQVFPTFTRGETLGLSWWISVMQIGLFLGFVLLTIRQMIQMRLLRLIGLMGFFMVGVLLMKNADFFLRRPISLTRLKPVGYRQDYLEPVYNKTVESARGVKFWNRLSVNYYFYDKGIGSHADSEITYHLAHRFSKFSTDYGVDTEAEQSAKVYYSIFGDGRELFKSDVKGRFDKPGTTEVDVKGVNYLTLKITRATESNFGAHADWLNPELVR